MIVARLKGIYFSDFEATSKKSCEYVIAARRIISIIKPLYVEKTFYCVVGSEEEVKKLVLEQVKRFLGSNSLDVEDFGFEYEYSKVVNGYFDLAFYMSTSLNCKPFISKEKQNEK